MEASIAFLLAFVIRLLELDREFYRSFNRQFVLGYRVGQPLIEGIRRMLEGKRDDQPRRKHGNIPL